MEAIEDVELPSVLVDCLLLGINQSVHMTACLLFFLDSVCGGWFVKLWFIAVFGCVVSGLRCAWFGIGSGLYVSTEIAY